jgi:hypothetical protein
LHISVHPKGWGEDHRSATAQPPCPPPSPPQQGVARKSLGVVDGVRNFPSPLQEADGRGAAEHSTAWEPWVAAHEKYCGMEEGIPPSQQWGWIPRPPWRWRHTSTAGLVASLSHVVKIFAGVGGKVDVGLSGTGFGLAQRISLRGKP